MARFKKTWGTYKKNANHVASSFGKEDSDAIVHRITGLSSKLPATKLPTNADATVQKRPVNVAATKIAGLVESMPGSITRAALFGHGRMYHFFS